MRRVVVGVFSAWKSQQSRLGRKQPRIRRRWRAAESAGAAGEVAQRKIVGGGVLDACEAGFAGHSENFREVKKLAKGVSDLAVRTPRG